MDDMLAALALSGGTTLVAAMATEAWLVTRTGAARLFRRRSEGTAAEPEGGARAAFEEEFGARLDGDNALVLRASGGDVDRVRQALATVWEVRIRELLREHPDAVEELTALIAEVQAALPRLAGPHQTQTNTSKDNSRIYAALGGNVIVHPGPPGEGTPPRHPADGNPEAGAVS
ncbi:hypothetical protein ABZV68_32520 [Streptomyces clavifer]|uniref:hypothetical protein n=1 Tax=Streptomyces clavifer TaxID=68188 RepID=UPI0033A24C8E